MEMKYFLGRWFGNLAYLISNCLSWLGNFRGIEIKGFICSPVMCNIVSIGGKLLVWNSESPFAKVLSLSLSLSHGSSPHEFLLIDKKRIKETSEV